MLFAGGAPGLLFHPISLADESSLLGKTDNGFSEVEPMV